MSLISLLASASVAVSLFQTSAERPFREVRTWIPFSPNEAATVPVLDLDAPAATHPFFGPDAPVCFFIDGVVPSAVSLSPLKGRSVLVVMRTPPANLKLGGDLTFGWLRTDALEPFADFCVETLRAFRRAGVDVAGLTHRNAPDSELDGSRPGCIWGPGEERPFLGRILPDRLSAAGLGDVPVWYQDGEPRRWRQANWVWTLEDPSVITHVKAIAWDGHGEFAKNLPALRRRHPSLPVHFVFPPSGGRLSVAAWGRSVLTALNAGCRACIRPATGTLPERAEDFLRHVLPYVARGAAILETGYAHRRAQVVTAFRNPDGTFVVVAVSGNDPAGPDADRPTLRDDKLQLQVKCNGLYSSFQLPSGTVSTILLKPTK